MKRHSITTILLLLPLLGFGNGLFSSEYNWEQEPQFEEIQEDQESSNAIILKDFKAVEFTYDLDNASLLQYNTVHSKVHVNTHEAVEMYNKVYMPMARVLGIVDLRVRVITEYGVEEMEELDIKDYEGGDDYASYKYFAIDGVEVGSQIEYIYTFKMTPQLEGGREFLQSNEPKLNTEFHLYCDASMFFKTKSYNGFSSLALDTAQEGKNHYHGSLDWIDALKPEMYAPYQDNLMRVEYKLDFIEPAEEVKLNTYDQIANQLNLYLRSDLSKKENRALSKLNKELGLGDYSEIQKVRVIEDFIKQNIAITEQNSDEMENVGSILENYVANERGVIKLYLLLFDFNGIQYEYGLTSDRSSVSMDPEFESYAYLEHYFFYFPHPNAFMAPSEMLYRVGYLPFNWTNNYGLFIKSTQLGEVISTTSDLRFIDPLPYDASEDRLDIAVEIEADFAALNLEITRTLSGYNATFVQPIFEIVPESETKLVINELLNMSGKDVELVDYGLKNVSMDSFYLKPFVIQGRGTTTSAFFGKAGNRYLLNIGELIGEQVEMYQEEERKLPVENEFNRHYDRKIAFDIPEGYRCNNLDDLIMDIYHEEQGERSMAFTSSYEMVEDKIIVQVTEYYKNLEYSVEEFEQFRKIINAAADFNKKVLIFEKG